MWTTFFIIGKDKQHLALLIPKLSSFLEEELGLTLHPDKVFLQQAYRGTAFLGIFVKPHRRYLLRKMRSRISVRMDMMNRCLSGREVDRDGLLYISCVANSYMGYMRHMNCHRFKRVLVERNVSFSRKRLTCGGRTGICAFSYRVCLAVFPFFPVSHLFSSFFPL